MAAKDGAVLRVVAGSYERVLYGFDMVPASPEFQQETGRPYMMETVFRYAAHSGCIKCLSVGGSFLVSGSTDEHIKLYDMKRCVEYGDLLQHQGSITALHFTGSHMLSCSEDGTVCVWRRRDWECLKTLRAGGSAVNSLAVHPSGKLALSASRAKQLVTWNLIKGRVAYQTQLKREATVCVWNVSGSAYALVQDSLVTVFDLASGDEVARFDNRQRVHDAVFLADDRLAVACEDAAVRVLAMPPPAEAGAEAGAEGRADATVLYSLGGHESRVKALHLIEALVDKDGAGCAGGSSGGGGGSSGSSHTERFLVSVSSDSHVRVWQFPDGGDVAREPACVALVNTRARLTCVGGYPFATPPTAAATADGDGDGQSDGGDGDGDGDEAEATATPTGTAKRKAAARNNDDGAARKRTKAKTNTQDAGTKGRSRKPKHDGKGAAAAAVAPGSAAKDTSRKKRPQKK